MDRQRVVFNLRAARIIHVMWADWDQSDPDIEVAGDREWHLHWVRVYNAALGLLGARSGF